MLSESIKAYILSGLMVAVSMQLCIGSLSAEIRGDLAACLALKADAERLACYDRLAQPVKADPVKAAAFAGSGKWRIESERSPLDDSENVFLHLEADNSNRVRPEGTPQPRLSFRCKEGRTDGYVQVEDFLEMESLTVQTRLDQDKAQSSIWAVGADHHAVFVPNSMEFIRQLEGRETMLVQLALTGEDPLLIAFDIRGLPEALKPLKQACKW